MYTRDPFTLSLPDMCAFVRARSFGVLATYHDKAVRTSPLPLDLRTDDDGELFVAGHVARVNDMSAAFASRPPATATVLGPDSYVPAEWFGTRSRIPTWVYCAVEISGTLELSEPSRTRTDVETLIDRLQAEHVEDSTWTLGEMPADLTTAYLKNIVGFRLCDVSLKSCFRLNQRKDGTDALATALGDHQDTARRELAGLVLAPPTECAR